MSALANAPFRLPRQPSEAQLLAKYFRAFGDPTRLQMLELLRERELTVGELVEQVGSSQPRVSAHLACLRWCGFVRARRHGRAVFYRLADERVGALIDLARALLAENAEHLAACGMLERS